MAGRTMPHADVTERTVPHADVTEGCQVPHADVTEGCPAPHADVTEAGRAAAGPQRTDALMRAYRARYSVASKAEKGRLLDEVVAQSGCHRKHAVRLLTRGDRRPRLAWYDDAVRDALVVAWEAAGRVGSRRLKALMPELVPTLVRDGRLAKNLGVMGKLLSLSPATIDRRLAPVRARAATVQLEGRLESLSAAAVRLASFRMPSDLPADERRYIQERFSALLDDVRRLAPLAPANEPREPK